MKMLNLTVSLFLLLVCSCTNLSNQKQKNASVSVISKKNIFIVECFLLKDCPDCKRVKFVIERIKAEYPNILFKNYYCEIGKNKDLLKEKCIELNIPEDERMEVPTIIVNNKYLVNKNINFNSLEELLIVEEE